MAGGAILLNECVRPGKRQRGCPSVPGEESGAENETHCGVKLSDQVQPAGLTAQGTAVGRISPQPKSKSGSAPLHANII